ncbi:acyloxyacyl hydrolase [Desulfocurvibacter africanus]|uniref:Lipid A 3-O-deacylase-related protein n=1 Tax=Desulfocurvibacter africanus subsp. africanus str. Walvis Bay TaxID=690850 RepID=F3YYW0_DESAF|nr:acyloxyacyl hydrolase [Desulfocurvibacter africanus]EGJ51936.1 Lipid A 3-O-deacylase-related protein [Desulfocurvibacter africanus subsp. africanus str. Walvis Bay]
MHELDMAIRQPSEITRRSMASAVCCRRIILVAFISLWAVTATASMAQAQDAAHVPTRYGAALAVGNDYTPNSDIGLALIYGFAQFDYDAVWPHRAPEPLRFKVEASAGLTTWPFRRAVASAGIMAQYYLDSLASDSLRPYAEAGIHAIYTDFRVEGQGLRFNFNPQAGIGTDILRDNGPDLFIGLRAHHISNAGLDDDNTGINSLLLMFGTYF